MHDPTSTCPRTLALAIAAQEVRKCEDGRAPLARIDAALHAEQRALDAISSCTCPKHAGRK